MELQKFSVQGRPGPPGAYPGGLPRAALHGKRRVMSRPAPGGSAPADADDPRSCPDPCGSIQYSQLAPGTHPAAAGKASARPSPRFPRRARRRIFARVQGGELASITYRRPWAKARHDTLSAAEAASPLAGRVYDLRHACVSTRLNGGIPPAQVAEWAGHSVAILLKIYAKCLDGQDDIAKRRIEEALGDPATAPSRPARAARLRISARIRHRQP